ncbi:MAG: PD40 domain-containing protein [Anaerolineae bacterium]|nr:PD40 domain-containing protein [Anaerolineae bacterium]
MNIKKILYLVLIISVVFGLRATAPALAQTQDNLDTTLARAAANSFLITLLRPELVNTMKFYLLDSVNADEITAAFQANPATSFEVTGADWVSDVTYQVKATMQPGNRPIAVYAGKYNGRWRIEGIDLPLAGETAPAATGSGEATAAGVAAPVGVVAAVADNGSGQLVFQTQNGGDIYLINADGTGLRWITSGIDPQLSPDGTRIAFTRWEPRYELFTINIDGSNEQAWTHGWRQMKSPTWSADGSKLTFSYQQGGRLEKERHEINLTLLAMRGQEPKIPAEAVDIKIVERNGMQFLVYYLPADAHWFLKQIDLATSQLIDLSTERHSYGPTGHPTEANQVIYKGKNGIALNNIDTGQDQPVSTDHRDHTPVISPDGSKVVITYWQDGHWEIYTMNIDGSNRQRLTETPLTVLAENTRLVSEEVYGKMRFVPQENPHFNNAAPVWSPDGTKIAFLTNRTGQWEIWLMNTDGSDQRPMFASGQLDGISLNYAGTDERMLSWR